MLISFCGCDDPDQRSHFDEDLFPNSKQIWGMVGTIVATVACWIVYAKMHINKVPQQNIPHHNVSTRIHSSGHRGRK